MAKDKAKKKIVNVKADRKLPGGEYRFQLTEKDETIQLLRTECQRLGGHNLPHHFLQMLSEKSGVHISTIRNWFFGDTLHPHHITMKFVAEAMGCRFQLVRDDGTELK